MTASHPASEHEALVELLGQWWANPTLTGVGRLPARTSTRSFASLADAREGRRPRWYELDDQWWFRLVNSPADAPEGWTRARCGPRSGWRPIEVPGCWTMQGFGDLPHYTNVVMPFAGDPPDIPERPMAGLYRRRIDRSELEAAGVSQRSPRCILHIGGAESAAAVWLNGSFVGIMTDSRLASEFDITGYLARGANELAIMVVRWSAHTWVEDQDHWFHGGLHRRVALRAAGLTSLADVQVTTTVDGGPRLDLQARIIRDANAAAGDWTVRCRLEHLDGRAVRGGKACAGVPAFSTAGHVAQMGDAYSYGGPIVGLTLEPSSVRPWSDENPARYRLLVELLDRSGRSREVVPVLVGFNSVRIEGPDLLINREPARIAGVNRHDHHHLRGKACSDEELRAEVSAIKRAGFNAIRTAHYPPDPVVLDACDEIGLFVICEANLESHARLQEVVHDPRYAPTFIERVQRMVATHRNHPSIIAWSLGNESGYGAAHDAAAAWVRRTDPSRFVHYEGANAAAWNGDDSQPVDRASDIDCPMYPGVDRLVEWVTATRQPQRPVVLCEYSHAMGNSNGELDRYWAAFDEHRGLHGGFIWDWRDQGLVLPDVTGTDTPVYGGAFGDRPNDGAFCCNGITGWDAMPHPAVEEHRWLSRPVRTEFSLRRGRLNLKMTSQRRFTDTSDLRAELELAADGEVFRRERHRIQLAPGGCVAQSFAVPELSAVNCGEVTATVRWVKAGAHSWCERGHTVAWDQAVLVTNAPAARPQSDRGDAVDSIDETLTELLGERPRIALWRAPVDNDGQRSGPLAGLYGPLRRWQEWGLHALTQVSERRTTRGAVVHHVVVWSTSAGHRITHRRRLIPIEAGWSVRDEFIVPEELDDLPRVGVRFSVPGDWSRLRWYGRGPWETASDRRAAPLGIWQSDVEDQFVPYMTPQHHGTHIDTRWFELLSAAGSGVRFELAGASFDVSRYSPESLTSALTLADLRADERIHVHIDAALRGVGTGACGPDTRVRVAGGRYRLNWTVREVGDR